jgi:hypothetical protein
MRSRRRPSHHAPIEVAIIPARIDVILDRHREAHLHTGRATRRTRETGARPSRTEHERLSTLAGAIANGATIIGMNRRPAPCFHGRPWTH